MGVLCNIKMYVKCCSLCFSEFMGVACRHVSFENEKFVGLPQDLKPSSTDRSSMNVT